MYLAASPRYSMPKPLQSVWTRFVAVDSFLCFAFLNVYNSYWKRKAEVLSHHMTARERLWIGPRIVHHDRFAQSGSIHEMTSISRIETLIVKYSWHRSSSISKSSGHSRLKRRRVSSKLVNASWVFAHAHSVCPRQKVCFRSNRTNKWMNVTIRSDYYGWKYEFWHSWIWGSVTTRHVTAS